MKRDDWKLKNIANILDWDEVDKSMMIGYLSLAIMLWDVVFLSVIYFSGLYLELPPEQRIDSYGYRFSVIASLLYGVFCVVSLMAGSVVRSTSKATKHLFMYVGMSVYAVGNSIVIHIFGELSTPSGFILAGAPIVGWILFETRAVILATLVGILGIVFSFALTYFDVIPYAPIVNSSSGVDFMLHKNPSYILTMLVFIFPHLIALLFLSHSAIANWKKREAEASYLAGIDSLTNIPNRRQIIQILQTTISESIQKDTTTSIAMFDLDNFKSINDKYGHHAGDHVLNECVRVVGKRLRSQDHIGRLGGDEFFVILPDCSQKHAVHVMNRCLEKLRSTDVAIDGVKHNITASFGVLALPSVLDTDAAIDELIESSFIHVDTALYQAKQKGRNQVYASPAYG